MAFTLDAAQRKQILDFVRPLSVGIDGATNFGFVERRIRISDFLEGEEGRRAADREGGVGEAGGTGGTGGTGDPDPARLFLLATFAGLPSARRITPDSREDLLLRSLRIPFEEIRILVSSLSRIESDPKSLEEKIVHDAMLLETVGAYGVTQLLVAGSRERMTLAEMARDIAEKMSAARFATESGRRLAADRVAFAALFARTLADEAGEFAPATVTV